jgi:hypothetical protein
MNEHHPTAAPSATPQAGAPSRRRLLRGALAVPAVLTVYSGSAFAVASHMRCLANANAPGSAQQNVPVSSNAQEGGLVRVGLHRFTRGNGNGNGNTIEYWLYGGDLPAGQGRASTLPSTTQWQQFDVDANRLIGDRGGAPAGGSMQISDSHFAAVLYDSEGFIVGVGSGPNGGAIGVSCWNSFLPGAAR